MLVSIITPAYNAAKLIPHTINSVLAQTYTEWEMIIVNDGSKDETIAVVEEFIAQNTNENGECKIKLITQENGGSAKARNTGIKAANGRYIALLDSDDVWDAEFLQSQLELMKQKDAVLVYGSYRRINEKGEEILRPLIATEKTDYKDMTWLNRVGCLTGVYDTQKFGKIYFDESLKSLLDDYDYWLRIVQKCGVAYGSQKVLSSYRIFASQTTGKKSKLVGVHYRFYRNHLKMGVLESVAHTIYWGVAGFFKFLR